MTVGERIKQRRMELGLTQDDLAKLVGYNGRSGVCAAETKGDNITTTKVKKFAKALGVTFRYLMGWEDINGVPIPTEHAEYKPEISDYRPEFVEEAIEVYRDIQGLTPDRRKALQEYLQYLKSQP